MKDTTPPPIDPKYAIYARVAIVAIAYLAYRTVESKHLAAGIFLGVGVLLVGYAVVTRLTTWAKDRSEMMQMGQTILGLGLVALGIGLLVT